MRIPGLSKVLKLLGVHTDSWGHDRTLLGYASDTYKHIHNPGLLTPANGSVITVTTDGTAQTFGSFVDVIEANQLNRAFDIHWLSITDIQSNGVYVVELHRLDGDGLSVALLSQVAVSRADNFSRVGEVYTQIPVQHANARVGVRALKNGSGASFVKFVAHYHDYQ